METIVVTVKGVKVFVDENNANVQLTFAESFKGFAQDENDGYAETDVKTVSFYRSKLTAQLCEASDDIAMYRATLDHAFGQKEFGVILFNAKMKLNRDRKSEGDVVGEGDDAYTLDRDCYFTDVVSIKLSDKALRQLDIATSL